MSECVRRGHDVLAVSRRTGVDLSTGAGLEAALSGAGAVVNCADDTAQGDAVTVDGARRLAEAANSAATPVHLVHISIVGIDDFPMAYYQRKWRAEQALATSGAAVTVMRTTQFHSLAAFFARSLTRAGVTFRVGNMAFQPVDSHWVAAQLVDLCEGPSPTGYCRAASCPTVSTSGPAMSVARLRAHAGRRPTRVVRLPAAFGAPRAFGRRQNVPSPGQARTGGRSFDDWLAAQPAIGTGR